MSNNDEPCMVDEFGEVIALRPDGCPSCGAKLVKATAQECWRCNATFKPTSEEYQDPPSNSSKH
jgi:ribosomal protein L37AE/L43A